MQKALICLLLPLILLCGCQKNAEQPAAEQPNYTQLAITAASRISEGDFDGLYAMFDQNQQSLLKASEIKNAWTALVAQLGEFQYYSTDFALTDTGGAMTADIPFVFAEDTVTISLFFNTKGEISGLYFAEPPANNSKISLRLPLDHDVTFGYPYVINGSLTLPEGQGPFPAVILLHDYGPSDRNGTVGPNLPFFDLAEQLSAQGIAVLRYDKRSYTYGAEMAEQGSFTVYDEIIDDAAAAFRFLQTQPQIDGDRIAIACYGISGQFVPRLDQALPDCSGYIMLNTSARPISETLLASTAYAVSLENTLTEESKAALLKSIENAAQNIAALTPDNAANYGPLLGAPPEYWLDLQTYDPLSAIGTVTKPLLVIHSGRDYEVTESDAQAWQKALRRNANAQLQTLGNLNHLLMEGVGKSNPQEYQTKGTVSDKVTQSIAGFITQE